MKSTIARSASVVEAADINEIGSQRLSFPLDFHAAGEDRLEPSVIRKLAQLVAQPGIPALHVAQRHDPVFLLVQDFENRPEDTNKRAKNTNNLQIYTVVFPGTLEFDRTPKK